MVVNDQIAIKANPGFTGKTEIQVVVNDEGTSEVINVQVTVLPEPVPNTQMVPKAINSNTISWSASPNAISYEVQVYDQTVCVTSQTSCQVAVPIGPKTKVEVVAKGNDETENPVVVKYENKKPIPALTAFFATGKSVLSATAKTELQDIAQIIKVEGFSRIQVYGHTDIRGGIDNNKLSKDRAQVVINYLKKLVPNTQFKIAGYASTQPIGDNQTEAGLAANRRAEVSVW